MDHHGGKTKNVPLLCYRDDIYYFNGVGHATGSHRTLLIHPLLVMFQRVVVFETRHVGSCHRLVYNNLTFGWANEVSWHQTVNVDCTGGGYVNICCKYLSACDLKEQIKQHSLHYLFLVFFFGGGGGGGNRS